MTVGTLEKLFPDMKIALLPDFNAIDPVEEQIQEIVSTLSPTDKAKCLKILAANFSEQIVGETNGR